MKKSINPTNHPPYTPRTIFCDECYGTDIQVIPLNKENSKNKPRPMSAYRNTSNIYQMNTSTGVQLASPKSVLLCKDCGYSVCQ